MNNFLVLCNSILEIIQSINNISEMKTIGSQICFAILLTVRVLLCFTFFSILIIGEKKYKNFEKIQKNKKVSNKIMFENYCFIKERYPFFIAYILWFISYAVILFNIKNNQLLNLSIIAAFLLSIIFALDLKYSINKGIIKKIFVEKRI